MKDDEKDVRGVQVKIERKVSKEEAKQLATEKAVELMNQTLRTKKWDYFWTGCIAVLENGSVHLISQEDTDNYGLEAATGGLYNYVAEHNLYEFGLEKLLCDFELKGKEKPTTSIPNTKDLKGAQTETESIFSKEEALKSATEKAIELFNEALSTKTWNDFHDLCMVVMEDGRAQLIDNEDTDSYGLNGNSYGVLRHTGEHLLHKFVLIELLCDFQLQPKADQPTVSQSQERVETENKLNQ